MPEESPPYAAKSRKPYSAAERRALRQLNERQWEAARERLSKHYTECAVKIESMIIHLKVPALLSRSAGSIILGVWERGGQADQIWKGGDYVGVQWDSICCQSLYDPETGYGLQQARSSGDIIMRQLPSILIFPYKYTSLSLPDGT